MNKDYIVLYSTNTKLAHFINEKYYEGKHFVWCGPAFDPTKQASTDIKSHAPPSSSPYEIYQDFKKDIERNDKHSAKIESAKAGLKKGANIMYVKEDIDAKTKATIEEIVENATPKEFEPMLYVIPITESIKKRIISVPIGDKANPLSEEYQIVDLTKKEFDIIQF